MNKCLLTFLFIMSYVAAFSQTPSDAIMMKQAQSCFAVTYDKGSWDHYWEGTDLRTNGNVGTFHRRMIMPMIAIGLHDKINLIVATPHIKTYSSEESGGYLHGVSGMQDISVALKGEVLKKEIGQGALSALTTVAFATPMTNYLSDYMPYSIGSGANEFTLRGILQYRMKNGFYVQSSFGHSWRGLTEIERDYYYNNGSYYTNKMDVPNALNYNAAVGMWLFENSLRFELNYSGSNCTSGDDIRRYNAPQPTNKVEISQGSVMAQYYVKKIRGVGFLAYYSKALSGRNMGEFTNVGGGITYQFTIKKFKKPNS